MYLAVRGTDSVPKDGKFGAELGRFKTKDGEYGAALGNLTKNGENMPQRLRKSAKK
jgi:hypothetical protein